MSPLPLQIENSGFSGVSSTPGIWCNAAVFLKWDRAGESCLLRKAAQALWEGGSGPHTASTSLCDPRQAMSSQWLQLPHLERWLGRDDLDGLSQS